jgi:Domain of unknown function (DUF4865)
MIAPNLVNALLLQYETPLPEDFDIKAIRERIREIAPAFDRMSGLLVKFYGLNTQPETPANEYVSTYLWQNPSALREFLEGDGFGNYTEAFARPSARTWLLHEIVGEFDELAHTRFLLKQTVGIPRKAKVGHSLRTWAKRPLLPSTIARIIGFDSVTWEIIELTALSDRPDLNHAINAHLYSVVHVSKPGATSHVTE